MISYRDMTFCQFHEDCTRASACERPLTDEVRDAASRWWPGGEAPICVFAEKPPCHTTGETT